MNSKQRNNQGSGLIFLVVLAVGLFYMFGNSDNQEPTESEFTGMGGAPSQNFEEQTPAQIDDSSEASTGNNEDASDDNQDEPQQPDRTTSPKLLVLRNTGASKQLVTIGAGQVDQVVFTDSDEQHKILRTIGVDNQGFAYALVDNNYNSTQGKIARIATDLSGTISIIDQSEYMGAPSMSFDGKTFLLTRFDNSEQNFGFSLIKKSGNNETTIDQDQRSISHPTFSRGGKIAYIKGQAGIDSTRLMINTGNSSDTVYTFPKEEVVTGLTWLDENNILIAREKFENNAANNGTIQILNLSSKNLVNYIDLPGKERHLKAANGWVAAITGNISSSADMSGNVVIFNSSNKNTQTLTKAEAIVGWLN